MKYLIVIEKTKIGYSAYLPDVPGCAQLILTGEVVSLVEFTVYLQKINCDGYS